MSSVKCFICKTLVSKKEAFSYLKDGQKVKKNFCSEEHLQNYLIKLQVEEQKKLDTAKFNELDIYIASEILLYEIGQIVPPNLKKRVQKLHKNYSYEVIQLCFELLKPELNSILSKKEFTDEQHMINYIMVVVENNINDAYKIWKRKEEIKQKQELHTIDVDLMEELNDSPSNKKKTTDGIMEFLEEEDY